MAKKTKKKVKWLHVPARWVKSKGVIGRTTSGWRLIWGKEKTHGGVSRVWPAECPECSKRLRVQLRGMVCRTFVMKEDGGIGRKVGADDVDILYDNPIFICAGRGCDFEYEAE